jgi:hypothetical protein
MTSIYNGIYKNVENLEKKIKILEVRIDKLNSYNETESMRQEDKSYFRGRTLNDIYEKNKILKEKLKKERKQRLKAEEKLEKIVLINKMIKFFNTEIAKLTQSTNELKQNQKNLTKLALT